MHYTAVRIVVQAMSGDVVVEREVEAMLAGESGLAFHPALVEDHPGGDPEALVPLYTVTHVPTGCALGSLPIRGEAFAREALEKIAQIQERYPHSVRWQDERPFASEEIARLACQLIHWILVEAWARSTLAARWQASSAVPPARSPRKHGGG